ncbi:MAG: HAD hydrolase family protein [Methanospirillaceae archaeon]|nr:HAD hydrolase family protein [Methanospirillaceae archaeon]
MVQWMGVITPALKEAIKNIRFIAFDFDGVFTDNMVYTFEDGKEAVKSSRFDGEGLQKLRDLGIEMAVISAEKNPVVIARCRKLKIPCYNGCDDKLTVLQDIIKEKNITMKYVAYVGNDIRDIPCLLHVEIPIVVCDAHPDVFPYASYITSRPGGTGAVREICDMISKIQTNK